MVSTDHTVGIARLHALDSQTDPDARRNTSDNRNQDAYKPHSNLSLHHTTTRHHKFVQGSVGSCRIWLLSPLTHLASDTSTTRAAVRREATPPYTAMNSDKSTHAEPMAKIAGDTSSFSCNYTCTYTCIRIMHTLTWLHIRPHGRVDADIAPSNQPLWMQMHPTKLRHKIDAGRLYNRPPVPLRHCP